MKTLLRFMAASLVLLPPSFSLAQTVKKGDYTYTPPACTVVSRGTVDCRLTMTYTGREAAQSVLIRAGETKAYDAAGATYVSVSFQGGGQAGTGPEWVALPTGIPVQLTYRFEAVPTSVTTFRGVALNLNTLISFQNVPVRSVAPAPAPLPVASGVPTGFTLSLTRCTPQGTSFVCTATLTPVR
ncbi:hypothetical protein GO986_17395 [Deinococcus sp. HMF7620]|uniref:Uncharacterized protein n=1 Tax=Deinococcus arboris TaxID=2682977 RepID=A0A7C9LMW4_9DEIO|nr:hypothetical protein [Deinococcus arboris]MVN88518.1 hypothetical protein [Deinococcus arboris]